MILISLARRLLLDTCRCEWNENRITQLRSKTMKETDRIVVAGGITAAVAGIGAELGLFL